MKRLHEWMKEYEPEFVFGILVLMSVEVVEVLIQILQVGKIP